MVDISTVVFAVVFGSVGLWSASRLASVLRTYVAVRRAAPESPGSVHEGQQLAVAGDVFVEQPAAAADRLFDAEEPVGGYVWRAGFDDAGRYTYDFDRGEFRQTKNTFASGVETGAFGVEAGGREFAVDLDAAAEGYDASTLPGLDVGDPKSNVSLPFVLTDYVWSAPNLDLSERPGGSTADRLADIVDVHADGVQAENFFVDARGLAAGDDCYVSGEVAVEDGVPTLTGTDATPLLVADGGYTSFRRTLGVRAAAYAFVAAAIAGGFWLFVL